MMSDVQEIFQLRENITTIEVQAGELVNIRKKDITKKAARVFAGGKINNANYLGNIDNSELIESARRNEPTAVPFDYEPNADATYKNDFRQGDLDLNDLIKSVEDILVRVKANLPGFVFSGKLHQGEYEWSLTTNSGVDMQAARASVGGYLVYKQKGSPNIIDGYFGADSALNADLEAAVDFQVPFLNAFDREAKIEPGKTDVCFLGPDSTLFKKIFESLDPNQYHSGAAFYAGQLGNQLFAPGFSLCDVALDPINSIVSPFDGEGTLREGALPVINNGVFDSIFYDLRSAKRFGAKTTGNGNRGSYNGSVQPTGKNLRLTGGEKTIMAQLAEMDRCVVILMAGGGDMTSLGDFSSPVQISFLVENGIIKGKLPQLTVSAPINEYLGDDFITVSSDSIGNGIDHALFTRMNLLVN